MKTRIQTQGGNFGSNEGTVWTGDLPFFPGALGNLRVVVKDEDGKATAYAVSQVALEIAHSGDYEQVLYAKGPLSVSEPELIVE